MISEKLIDRISGTDIIEIDQSRCLRMRFNKNKCRTCLEHCSFDAISIDESIDIKRDLCGGCMLCMSECPSGCFEMRSDFHSVMARLRKLQASGFFPVIGCNMKPDLTAHEKTSCLGFLSEEHIIALLFFMPMPLQINLTECIDCRNGFVVDALKKRLESVASKIPLNVSEKIIPVENKAALDFRDVSYDRRGFFRALKELTIHRTAHLFDKSEPLQTYSNKKLSYRRELLNKMLPILPQKIKSGILKNYYYTVVTDKNCNNCFACVGMCPTGALTISREGSESELAFHTLLCNGCGLCMDFCISSSIHIHQGFLENDRFESDSIREEITI